MDILHYPTLLNSYLHGGIVDRKDVCVEDISAPVYYVEDESWESAGQALPFNHIILNRARLADEPDFVHDYVFLHESGHKRWPWPLQIFLLFGQFAYVLILIILTIASPWIVIDVLSATTSGDFLLSLAGAVIAYIILVIPFLTVTWFDEAHAEVYAISRIGRSTYLEIQEIRESKSRSLSSKIRLRLMYPPTSLILAISRHRGSEY